MTYIDPLDETDNHPDDYDDINWCYKHNCCYEDCANKHDPYDSNEVDYEESDFGIGSME